MEIDTRVIVALSGGVDSTMAAALLLKQGYEVIGIHLRTWRSMDEHAQSGAKDSSHMARTVCAQLGIEFHEIDIREEFYKRVVGYFIQGYEAGLTPNPCVHCNRVMKWESLLAQANKHGAGHIATGHYARLERRANDKRVLRIARDVQKDQSYVLGLLGQEQLKRTLLPLGEFSKPDIRRLANDLGLKTADRPDSQDLCFLAGGDYRTFLALHAAHVIKPGEIWDQEGHILGMHLGLPYYTIGQRKGLRIAHPQPLYVIRKDLVNNRLVVGSRSELGDNRLVVSGVNWISGEVPAHELKVQVKIRYKATFASAILTPQLDGRVELQFDHPLADITPGQFAVFYDDDIVLGAGMIELSEEKQRISY